ncbi:MAG: antibiotic biosynthesis monooxygenase [Candidatus Sulfotelmatobacter sp.]
MIARVWHGYTKPENADAYEALLKPELLPGISKKKGYKGTIFCGGKLAPRLNLSPLCSGIQSIRFARLQVLDYETAIIPEERRKYLSKYDAKSAHYEIAAVHGLQLK